MRVDGSASPLEVRNRQTTCAGAKIHPRSTHPKKPFRDDSRNGFSLMATLEFHCKRNLINPSSLHRNLHALLNQQLGLHTRVSIHVVHRTAHLRRAVLLPLPLG